MPFIVESELMKNLQAAGAMTAGQDFSAVQTDAGYAVFFTQDMDGKLRALRETSDDQNNPLGWQRVDLTPVNGANVTNFAIAQNPQTLNFDIAVAGVVNGRHTLWISQNNSAVLFANLKDGAITWLEMPPPTQLTIAKLHIMNLFQGSKSVQMIYADVFRRSQEHSQLTDRYYINPVEQPYWFPRSMGADFFADSMRTCVGRPAGELNAGVYTFGIMNTSQQLTYQPSMLGRAAGHSPNVTRLIAPPNSYSIASAPAQDASSTNLFVAAQDGLHIFQPDNQYDGAEPVKIFDANKTALAKLLFNGIRKMTARWMGDQTVLFLLNTKQQLLYTSCKRGDELHPDNWKLPMPICSRVQNYSFFVDTEANKVSSRFGNVVFAQTANRKLTMLSQNLSTGIWETSQILLPSTKVSDVYETTTFNSRVKLINANNQIQPDTVVNVKALEYTTAIIDGVSYFLEPGVAVSVSTKTDGSLSIIQDAVGLAAGLFTLTVGNDEHSTVTVDPTKDTYARLQRAKTEAGIKQVTYKNSSGIVVPLIPTGPNQNTIAGSMAGSIEAMLNAKASLISGNLQSPSKRMSAPSTLKKTADPARGRRDSWWDVDLGDLIQAVADGLKEFVDDVESAAETVTNFVVQTAGDAWEAITDIGSELYGAAVDTFEAVGDAAVGVFDWVKTTVDDLLDWLGFLFDWDDIKRTQKFLKKILTMYTNNIVSSIDTLITNSNARIDEVIAKAKKLLDDKEPTNIDNFNTAGQTATIGSRMGAENSTVGDSPQANWATQMIQEHASSASSDSPPAVVATTTDFTNKFDSLSNSAPANNTTLNEKLVTFQSDVASKVSEMSPWDVVKKTCSVCLDLVKDFGKAMIGGVLSVVSSILSNMIAALQTRIDIPILSYVFETYIVPGSEMTVMEVTALVLAIPATVLYKSVKNEAPFPDEDTALFKMAQNATDWAGFKTALKASKPSRSRRSTSAGTVFVIIANCLGAIGAGVVTVIALFKKQLLTIKNVTLKLIAQIGIGGFIGFVMPNISGLIYAPDNVANVLNDFITVTAVVKACFDYGMPAVKSDTWMEDPKNGKFWTDKVSPWLDCFINSFWIIVLVGSFIGSSHSDNPSYDWIMLAANAAFDVGGIIAPLASDEIGGILPPPYGPPAYKIAKGAVPTLNIAYGVLCVLGCFYI